MPAPLPGGYCSQHIVISIEYLKQDWQVKVEDNCGTGQVSTQGSIQ